jgi:hypothetical protein
LVIAAEVHIEVSAEKRLRLIATLGDLACRHERWWHRWERGPGWSVVATCLRERIQVLPQYEERGGPFGGTTIVVEPDTRAVWMDAFDRNLMDDAVEALRDLDA